jgi:hypothetical protein
LARYSNYDNTLTNRPRSNESRKTVTTQALLSHDVC